MIATRGAVREQLKKVRYARGFFGRELVHTNLQIHYSCNFNCQICDFWRESHKRRPRLSLEQVSRISDALARVGPQIVSIGGGEPLLHPDIEGIVRTLARRHFPVMICNGWYITPERARALWAAGMYEISVSVDYADAELHDRQRGKPGAYERAIAALAALQKSRVDADQRVHMISVVLDDNLDHVEPLILKCRELGITYLVTLYSDKRGHKAARYPCSDVSRRLLALRERYPEFVVLRGYVSRFSRAIEQGGIGGCQAGKNLCNIDSQGDVSLCIDRVDEPVGNILYEDMSDILRKLRARHRDNRCSDCWTSCRGTVESIMYGPDRLSNMWDYYRMVRAVPLA